MSGATTVGAAQVRVGAREHAGRVPVYMRMLYKVESCEGAMAAA